MLQIIGLIVFFIVLVLSGVSFVHLLRKKGIFINNDAKIIACALKY